MLVLTRRPNEKLHIGPDVVVTVLGFKGNRVRLGIAAPFQIAVKRAEISKPVSALLACGTSASQENYHAAGGS